MKDAAKDHNVANLRDRLPESSLESRDAAASSAVLGGVTSMSMRRMAALQTGLLLVAVVANAATKTTMRIKVLDSETRAVSLGGNGVPTNCDQVTFDAYCRSSRTTPLTNTLLVQEGDGPPFRIACTIDSKFSKCTPLQVGESFDARREKHGITVYYADDKGKARKQLYTVVAPDANTGPAAPVAAVAAQPAPAAHTAAPVQDSSSPAPAPSSPAHQVPSQNSYPDKAEKARCNFGSTPSGAEITLDGKYVGNTPSEITVNAGSHIVAFSMPGFTQWKRDLTVLPGSELSISAVLQKVE